MLDSYITTNYLSQVLIHILQVSIIICNTGKETTIHNMTQGILVYLFLIKI